MVLNHRRGRALLDRLDIETHQLASILVQVRDVCLRVVVNVSVFGRAPIPVPHFAEANIEKFVAQKLFVKNHFMEIVFIALPTDDQANQSA